MRIERQPQNIVMLDNSLGALKRRFNDNSDKIRFIALLSPTCPLWRDKGARAVHENVFKSFPDLDISASIVWIPILDKDNFDAAIEPAKLLNDKRVQHFYDRNKTTGIKIAKSVGWTDNVAWDIYLFYRPLVVWNNNPPEPIYWMHQLTDNWATKEKYRTGVKLKNELLVSIQKLLSE